MKKNFQSVLFTFVILAVVLSGCASAATPVPSIQATTQPTLSPTFTAEPTATATTIPSPTPIPGLVVLPVDTLGKNNPWLPLDTAVRPGVNYVGFNTLKPPFNSSLVRRAFASAIDRDVLVAMAIKYKAANPVHATTLTPPETLGRDLYGEVGIKFDPQMAKDLLAQAGYTDPSSFPKVLFLVNASGDTAPGARFNVANAMADMWQTHLGITVEVQAIQSFAEYGDRIKSNTPDLFWLGWAADYNDPDNFLRELLHSDSTYNHGKFSNTEFDQLVEMAAKSSDPAERQERYIQAERILCETEAAVIPLWHATFNIP